jgi:hypothetical protein
MLAACLTFLYTNASTTYHTPYGPTLPMHKNRGNIQGDRLSPFLFILYLEPLTAMAESKKQRLPSWCTEV